MPLITLTTDYGTKDFYVSVLKAHLWKSYPDFKIVDITHAVNPFDLVEGSVLFKSSWHFFPEGTIHIIDIDPFGGQSNLLYFSYLNHHFVMPDNGLISLIFENPAVIQVYKLEMKSSHQEGFALQQLFLQAIENLLHQNNSDTPIHDFIQSVVYQPVYTSDTIHATVIYNDHYHNAVFNVDKKLFEQIRKNRSFEIIWKKFSVNTIHSGIHAVNENEIACFFNSAGLLTIGLNKSKASDLLGLQLHHEVLIDFLN